MLAFFGGYRMASARITIFLGIILLVLALLFSSGCEPERSGVPIGNSAPRVFMVNTPPDSAQFSRNPELNWYGTDIDGYIKFFRYAVIVDSLLNINGQLVTPEIFIEQADDDSFGWDTLLVELNNPQSSASIKLYGDTLDPVNVFTKQYFFVQAQDDKGQNSDIVFKVYSRNNHYPNTFHRARGVYINAVDADSPIPGIFLSWDGSDSLDYGRAEPPLEFEWKVFGPFDINDDVYVNVVKEGCVFNPGTNSYISCIDVPVLDLEAIPDTLWVNTGTEDNEILVGKSQPIATSKGPNYAVDPTDVWVTNKNTTIYNVFEGLNLTLTNRYKLLFWIRARDDGFVPDPTPAWSQFHVYEALFEKDIMVVDEGGYTFNTGRWHPRDLDTVKVMIKKLIDNAGFLDFDTSHHGSTDYFHVSGYKNDNIQGPELVPGGEIYTDYIDILSHKIIIISNDGSNTYPNESPSGEMKNVYFGLDMGCNAFMMSRNIGKVTKTSEKRWDLVEMTPLFQKYFGIVNVNIEGWIEGIETNLAKPIFTEEFIGAISNNSEYPDLYLDWGNPESLLATRYTDYTFARDKILQGLPEVCVGRKTQFASPLYLYLSRNGDASKFNGKVCGVRLQADGTRSATFMFSPLAMDTLAMQDAFTTTIRWLYEEFETQSSSSNSNSNTGPVSAFHSNAERRIRIQRYLDYLWDYATPEQRERYGLYFKPVVITED